MPFQRRKQTTNLGDPDAQSNCAAHSIFIRNGPERLAIERSRRVDRSLAKLGQVVTETRALLRIYLDGDDSEIRKIGSWGVESLVEEEQPDRLYILRNRKYGDVWHFLLRPPLFKQLLVTMIQYRHLTSFDNKQRKSPLLNIQSTA